MLESESDSNDVEIMKNCTLYVIVVVIYCF